MYTACLGVQWLLMNRQENKRQRLLKALATSYILETNIKSYRIETVAA